MTWGKKKKTSRRGTATKAVYIFAAALFILMVIACVSSGAADRLVYREEFETGKVEISLQELTAAGWDEAGGKTQLVSAGEKLNYAPGIANRRADCYVRVRIGISTDSGEVPGGPESYIYGIDNKWTKAGDYYYFKDVLRKGSYAEIFEGISVPEDWDSDTAGALTVSVKAEAIQSRNFQPDFDDVMPWGAVMLEEASAGGSTYNAEPVISTSEVTFDSAGSFQCDTEDLFDIREEILPGDRYSKKVTVKNGSGRPLDMAMNISAEENFINEKICLSVLCGNETIFCGTAAEAADRGSMAAGRIAASDAKEITVEMALPADADNDYAEIQDSIVWEITADDCEEDEESQRTEGMQTGDPSDLKPFAVAVLLACTVMGILVISRRKE